MKRGLGIFLLAMFVVGVLAVPSLHGVAHDHASCAGACNAPAIAPPAAACPTCHMALQATEVAHVDVAVQAVGPTVVRVPSAEDPLVATPFSLSRHPSRGPPCCRS